jgi:hypothetical protein
MSYDTIKCTPVATDARAMLRQDLDTDQGERAKILLEILCNAACKFLSGAPAQAVDTTRVGHHKGFGACYRATAGNAEET